MYINDVFKFLGMVNGYLQQINFSSMEKTKKELFLFEI